MAKIRNFLLIALLGFAPNFAYSEQLSDEDSVQLEFLSVEQSDGTWKFRMRLANQSNNDICFASFNDLTKQDWMSDFGERLSFSSVGGTVLEPQSDGGVWPLDTVVVVNRVLQGDSVQFSINTVKENYLFLGGDTYQVEVQFAVFPCDIFTVGSMTLEDLGKVHFDNLNRRLMLTDSLLIRIE